MMDPPYIKPDRPSPEQVAAWKRMTFEQKLELADQLRTSALRLREAWLRKTNPSLTDHQIQQRLREYLMHGAS